MVWRCITVIFSVATDVSMEDSNTINMFFFFFNPIPKKPKLLGNYMLFVSLKILNVLY